MGRVISRGGTYKYLLGLDVGQENDYTALTLFELGTKIMNPEDQARSGTWLRTPIRKTEYILRHLHRYPLKMSYVDIVGDVTTMIRSDHRLREGSVLVVDATGVGRAVVDQFNAKGIYTVSVTITGGTTVSPINSRTFNVPKRDLAMSAKLCFESGRIRMNPNMPLVDILESELSTFTRKVQKATGNETFEHYRQGDKDDLVLSLCLATWYGEIPKRKWRVTRR